MDGRGAVCFLPKEKVIELEDFISDAVLGGGRLSWLRFFDNLSFYFNRRFGPDWKEKDRYFKEFEDALRHTDRDSIS